MDRANLLTNVRNDIEYVVVSLTHFIHVDWPTFMAFSSAYHRSSATDSLLAERGRIDDSHRMTDDLLGYIHIHATRYSIIVLTCHIGKHMLPAMNSRDNARL